MAEAALSDLKVYDARPSIQVEGKFEDRVTGLVIGLDTAEEEGGLASLELRLSNVASTPDAAAELAFEDEQLLHLGSALTVFAGDRTAPQEIFRGVVTGLELEIPEQGPPELLVLAEDAAQRARMERRTAVHQDLTLAQLAEKIASRLGLRPVITGLRDGLGTWVQLNESDLAFLRRLLARYDGDVQVVAEELHVSPRAEVRRGTVELVLHSQLRRLKALADLSQQTTEVTVSGWDPLRGRRITATSRGAQAGPGRGRTGAELLYDALGERSEHLSHLAVTTAEEAQFLADAAFDRRARRFVCLEATAEGNPAVRVGSHVAISGVSPRFDNTYYVVRARHRWDVRQGYETDFEAESAFLGAA